MTVFEDPGVAGKTVTLRGFLYIADARSLWGT